MALKARKKNIPYTLKYQGNDKSDKPTIVFLNPLSTFSAGNYDQRFKNGSELQGDIAREMTIESIEKIKNYFDEETNREITSVEEFVDRADPDLILELQEKIGEINQPSKKLKKKSKKS